MRHAFKKTDEVTSGLAAFYNGKPIFACACGVKRFDCSYTRVTATKTSYSERQKTDKLYWSGPRDPRTGKGGWEPKAPPCSRKAAASGGES